MLPSLRTAARSLKLVSTITAPTSLQLTVQDGRRKRSQAGFLRAWKGMSGHHAGKAPVHNSVPCLAGCLMSGILLKGSPSHFPGDYPQGQKPWPRRCSFPSSAPIVIPTCCVSYFTFLSRQSCYRAQGTSGLRPPIFLAQWGDVE